MRCVNNVVSVNSVEIKIPANDTNEMCFKNCTQQ